MKCTACGRQMQRAAVTVYAQTRRIPPPAPSVYGPKCARKFNLLRRSPAKTIQTIGKQYAAECVQAGQLALEGFAA